jgi:formylglycine-generating enzyme required for sulfatase activity
MSPAEAARLLDLPLDSTPAQLETRFLELRRKLEDKIAKAPTPGLQAKYRASLAEITEAFEQLTLAADGGSLPVLERAETVERVVPDALSGSTPPADSRPSTPAKPKAKSGGQRELIIVALIAVLVLGAGGWWIVKTRAENAERARVETALRATQAELKIRWDTFEKEVSTSERRLSELKGDLRSAEKLPAPEQAELRARFAAQEDFVGWFQPYVARHPTRTLLAKLDAQLTTKAVAEASATAAELTTGLAAAEAELAAQRDSLLTITSPVEVVSDPVGQHYRATDAYGRSYANVTPFKGFLPFGRFEVEVTAPAGWQDYKPTLVVKRGEPLRVEARFERGTLRLGSTPAGQIYTVVNDKGYRATGTTPAELSDVPLGPVDVRVTGPKGWPDYRQNPRLVRDEPQQVDAVFGRGSLRVRSTPDGLPYVAKNKAGYDVFGTTPADLRDVPVGALEVAISRPLWNNVTVTFARDIVAESEAKPVEYEFLPGALEITSNPVGAEVWEGSKKLGVTPLTLIERIPGPFEAQVRASRHRPKKISGKVPLKDTLRLTATLEAVPEGEPAELGETRTIPGLNLVLIGVPAGRYQRGSTTKDMKAEPVHTVVLSRGYWLGKTEVTQAQWQAVMDINPSRHIGADRPVEKVNWHQAREFCRKLTERERTAGRLPDGFVYTLPTEAQWEYACRAGTTGDYAGDLDALAWYNNNGGDQASPVGRKQPNAWGFHDMHGNVREWCSDLFEGYRSGTVTDPSGAKDGYLFSTRGGSYFQSDYVCGSAFRDFERAEFVHSYMGYYQGFRLALSTVR